MAVALANINQHIYQSQQDGVQFSLLSLCKSPLRTDLEKLVEHMHSIASVKELLTSIQPDWQQFTELDESVLVKGPDSSFGISQDLFDNSSLSEATRQRLREAGTDASALIDLYQEYVRDQIRLQTSYMDEAALIGQENEQARRRKHDYTPIIYNSIKKLAEMGVLKRIIDEIHENEAMRQRGGEAMGYFASPC
jgi:ubiquitin carboxyl-terminal hydrolase L5